MPQVDLVSFLNQSIFFFVAFIFLYPFIAQFFLNNYHLSVFLRYYNIQKLKVWRYSLLRITLNYFTNLSSRYYYYYFSSNKAIQTYFFCASYSYYDKIILGFVSSWCSILIFNPRLLSQRIFFGITPNESHS